MTKPTQKPLPKRYPHKTTARFRVWFPRDGGSVGFEGVIPEELGEFLMWAVSSGLDEAQCKTLDDMARDIRKRAEQRNR